MWRSITYLWIILALSACSNPKQEPLSEEDKASLMLLGDSISVEMQNVLLQNVAGAIQKGGTDYAVEFCNIHAMQLTDSIAEDLNVYIQRLSDRTRNSANAIQTQDDNLAWEKIKSEKADFLEQHKNGEIYYYKPILIAMPTCLKCHGGKSDIVESTQNIIAQKYPNDKAVNYNMGDLRGMWKIKLN
mgnify:CR=1 FL=1